MSSKERITYFIIVIFFSVIVYWIYFLQLFSWLSLRYMGAFHNNFIDLYTATFDKEINVPMLQQFD